MAEAQNDIDQQQFSQALSVLSQISNQDQEPVVLLVTSAYAGLAGFRALQIYDEFYNNQNISPPILILFELSSQYSIDYINYSRSAISAIDNYNDDIQSRDYELNLPFALVNFYKISQILLNDSDLEHVGTFSKNWDPCSEADFPISDVREIIVALNQGIMAINQIRTVVNNADVNLVFGLITQIQNDIGVNTGVLDADAVQDTDTVTFRTFINQTVLSNQNVCPSTS